jgi:hypothetical protein
MSIKILKERFSIILLILLTGNISIMPIQKEEIIPPKQIAFLDETEIVEFVGTGGSAWLRSPYNLLINSFREWDHYHEPGTGEPNTLPSHRFWTWGKMNRPPDFPAGKCMPGDWGAPHIDEIFNCDRPIINDILTRHTGAMHQVGNEPNFGPYLAPIDYAYQFNLYDQYIHSIDPTAQILNGGITNWKDWQSWTTKFITEYLRLFGEKPPVDVWVVHPYALGFPDGELSALAGIKVVLAFRELLDNQGYKNTPIIIGEFSDAGGTNPINELVLYAITFCDWIIKNRTDNNIIGWYWWGSSTVAMGNAGLFDANRNITPVGEAYIAHCGLYKFNTYLPLIIK